MMGSRAVSGLGWLFWGVGRFLNRKLRKED